ncbi:hypothetical protein SBA4_6590001 [Candidatus Sulfopaludibacter sp. SbA4]|nr:hypothetical protein SBA4_6590001 [Candidatus Sulfopaludibacter sp. SbA4]
MLPAIHENYEWALDASLLLELKQVSFKKPVRDWHQSLIPAVVPRFVTPDQEDCRAERVECVERPQRLPGALGSQLAHLWITRTVDFRAVRKTEGRTKFHEVPNGVRHVILLFL